MKDILLTKMLIFRSKCINSFPNPCHFSVKEVSVHYSRQYHLNICICHFLNSLKVIFEKKEDLYFHLRYECLIRMQDLDTGTDVQFHIVIIEACIYTQALI